MSLRSLIIVCLLLVSGRRFAHPIGCPISAAAEGRRRSQLCIRLLQPGLGDDARQRAADLVAERHDLVVGEQLARRARSPSRRRPRCRRRPRRPTCCGPAAAGATRPSCGAACGAGSGSCRRCPPRLMASRAMRLVVDGDALGDLGVPGEDLGVHHELLKREGSAAAKRAGAGGRRRRARPWRSARRRRSACRPASRARGSTCAGPPATSGQADPRGQLRRGERNDAACGPAGGRPASAGSARYMKGAPGAAAWTAAQPASTPAWCRTSAAGEVGRRRTPSRRQRRAPRAGRRGRRRAPRRGPRDRRTSRAARALRRRGRKRRAPWRRRPRPRRPSAGRRPARACSWPQGSGQRLERGQPGDAQRRSGDAAPTSGSASASRQASSMSAAVAGRRSPPSSGRTIAARARRRRPRASRWSSPSATSCSGARPASATAEGAWAAACSAAAAAVAEQLERRLVQHRRRSSSLRIPSPSRAVVVMMGRGSVTRRSLLPRRAPS